MSLPAFEKGVAQWARFVYTIYTQSNKSNLSAVTSALVNGLYKYHLSDISFAD